MKALWEHSHNGTVSDPRKPESPTALRWEPQISLFIVPNVTGLCPEKLRKLSRKNLFLMFSLRQRKADSFLARGRSGITNTDYCIPNIS
jgi:hypothetical protein